MLHPVTAQRATSAEPAGVDVEPLSSDDRDVEVDQVTVLRRAAADAMGRVARAARSAPTHHVSVVQRKALVAQNRVAVMALGAQCIRLGRLDREVARLVAPDQQVVKPRTVRAIRQRPGGADGVRVVVAVLTTDEPSRSPLRKQAGDL